MIIDRHRVILRTLGFVVPASDEILLSFDEDTVTLDVDRDGTSFGFREAPWQEDDAAFASRLIDALAESLPTTRRHWGRPVPVCTLPAHMHQHAMTWRVDGAALRLSCPHEPSWQTTLDLSA